MMIQILVCATVLAWLAARPKRGRSWSSSTDGRCGELQGRASLAGRPCIGVASGSLARFRTSHRHRFRSLGCWGKLCDANREASRQTSAKQRSTVWSHRDDTRPHQCRKKTASPAKEDRIKTRPRPDPRKPLRPDLSQMCQKGLPGRLSTMADPRATLVLFPSPVVRPIPSRSSRGSPWQQTVACRALPCCGRGQLRSISQRQLNSGTAVSSLSPATACGRKWSVGRHGLMMLTDDPPTPSWRAKQGRI